MFFQEEKTKGPIGPLKLAAMNGLAMSRPMVLALMNDETRAPKDERVGSRNPLLNPLWNVSFLKVPKTYVLNFWQVII